MKPCDELDTRIELNVKIREIDILCIVGQAIGPLWDFCAPISIIVGL